MKKQDIKVRINNDAEAKEVRDLLLDSGEKISPSSYLSSGKKNPELSYINLYKDNWGYTDLDYLQGFTEISIPKLRELIQPKQTVTIEVNASDAPAFEMIIKALNDARVKHPEKWNRFDNIKIMSIALEESLEIIQAINDGNHDKTKAETIDRIVCFFRSLSGV